jgi:hypothetical protein
MNGHNEPFKYLWLGKKKLDVSNVSQGRTDIATEKWNKTISEEYTLSTKEMEPFHKIKDPVEKAKAVIQEQTIIKNKITKKMIEDVGLYLMRQDFVVLNRRYSFIKACIEYIKRYLLSVRLFKTLNKTQYEAFEDWISELLTGKKKSDIELQKGVLDLLMEMVKDLEERTNQDQETCLKLLQISRGVIVEQLMNSIQDPQV